MRIAPVLRSSLFLLTLFGLSSASMGQVYPDRPVKVVVPYAAGGNSDAIARVMAARLSEGLGQQFVVENRSGASGAIALEAVKAADPDGYTLLLYPLPQAAILPAMTKVKYDPVADFAPISNIGTNGYILTINPKLPVKTPAELLAWLKTQDKPTYASGGQGSHMNLTMVLFLQQTGLKVAAVHLRGGAEPMNNVVAGHIPMAFLNSSDVVQQATAGTVRALAVTTTSRIPQMPELPTMVESGFKDFVVVTWNGLAAPAGTPRPIIDKLSAEVAKAVKEPKIAERLISLGVTPSGNTPEDFAREVAADAKLWGDVVRTAGLQEK